MVSKKSFRFLPVGWLMPSQSSVRALKMLQLWNDQAYKLLLLCNSDVHWFIWETLLCDLCVVDVNMFYVVVDVLWRLVKLYSCHLDGFMQLWLPRTRWFLVATFCTSYACRCNSGMFSCQSVLPNWQARVLVAVGWNGIIYYDRWNYQSWNVLSINSKFNR